MKICLILLILVAHTMPILSSERLIGALEEDLDILKQIKEIPDIQKVQFFDALVNKQKQEIEGEIKLQKILLAHPEHERSKIELICRR